MDIENKCPSCGAIMEDGVCDYCGYKDTRNANNQNQQQSDPQQVNIYQQTVYTSPKTTVSQKDWLVTLLLCIFLGWLGIHKFYEGKIGMGIIYLLTGGVFGICWIIDIIKILLNKEKDKGGLVIHRELSRYL